jgi:uncharacterized protein (TIGR00304 family)
MTDTIKFGIYLVLIGFALILIGTILSAQNISFGGLVMIGPVPIAFGTSPLMTLIAMVIGLLLMIAYFILRRKNA